MGYISLGWFLDDRRAVSTVKRLEEKSISVLLYCCTESTINSRTWRILLVVLIVILILIGDQGGTVRYCRVR